MLRPTTATAVVQQLRKKHLGLLLLRVLMVRRGLGHGGERGPDMAARVWLTRAKTVPLLFTSALSGFETP